MGLHTTLLRFQTQHTNFGVYDLWYIFVMHQFMTKDGKKHKKTNSFLHLRYMQGSTAVTLEARVNGNIRVQGADTKGHSSRNC